MEQYLGAVAARLGPILTIVLATLLLILGVLVIVFPMLLGWVVGVTLFLCGVALLAAVLAGARALDD